MGPSCYIEYRGIRNRTIRGFYCIYIYICIYIYTTLNQNHTLESDVIQKRLKITTGPAYLCIFVNSNNLNLIEIIT